MYGWSICLPFGETLAKSWDFLQDPPLAWSGTQLRGDNLLLVPISSALWAKWCQSANKRHCSWMAKTRRFGAQLETGCFSTRGTDVMSFCIWCGRHWKELAHQHNCTPSLEIWINRTSQKNQMSRNNHFNWLKWLIFLRTIPDGNPLGVGSTMTERTQLLLGYKGGEWWPWLKAFERCVGTTWYY